MLGRILIGLVRFYRLAVSSWTLPTCRFTPTCSEYAIDAIRVYGAVRGTWLTLLRIGRCQPWGGHGYHPVPTPGKTGDRQSSVRSAGSELPSDDMRAGGVVRGIEG